MPKLSQSIINSVKRRTQIDYHAPHQYVFRYYDATAQAWRESGVTNRETALRDQFETRVRMALEMLGYAPDQAGEIAWTTAYNDYPKDWRQCVRDELKLDARERELGNAA